MSVAAPTMRFQSLVVLLIAGLAFQVLRPRNQEAPRFKHLSEGLYRYAMDAAASPCMQICWLVPAAAAACRPPATPFLPAA